MEDSMGAFSIFHWLIVLAFLAVYLVPVAFIVQKAGYSAWWFLIALVPLVNVIMLWVFAFADWPALRQPRS